MLNKISACFLGMTVALSSFVLPENIDKSKVVSANNDVIVMCVKRIAPISEEDRIEMAKCIYAECRGESVECQRGVCAVLYNRYQSGEYENMHEVIFAPNQFACGGFDDISEEDIKDQLLIVNKTLKYGPSLPKDIIYFRASHYHTMSDAVDFIQIDGTFFSSSKRLYKRYIGEMGSDSD